MPENSMPNSAGQPQNGTPIQPVQPSQPVQTVQPAQATIQPAPTPVQPAQAPVQQPAQPVQQPMVQQPAPQPQKPINPQPTNPQVAQQQQPQRPLPGKGLPPVRRPPNPRRLLYYLLGFFGCSIFLLIFFVLIFVAQTSSTGENALAKTLGVDTGSFINTLIVVVNVIFGLFAIVLFLVAMVGIFRTAMARKEDRDNRKRNLRLAAVAGGLLIFLVFIWIFIYLYLSSKKVNAPKAATATEITTDPANTLGLTAPVMIKFDGTKLPLDAKKYEILSFLWDFGDGQTSTVQSPSHQYTGMGKNNGRFDVKLNVTLKDKSTSEEITKNFTDIITISNVRLSADFKSTPESGAAPLRVKFDASDSTAPAGQIQAYDWDFDNNNVFTDASGAKVEYTFDQAGTYTVNLRITDNTGQPPAIISHDIIVDGPNIPTAVIEIPTTDGHYYTGTQYSFMGEKSSSPLGKVTGYQWDFGDQTPKASTRTVTHTYKNAGNYEITLSVSDDKAGKGFVTQKITIETPIGAPLPAFTTIPGPAKTTDGYISGIVPFEVNFDGSSSSEPNGSIVDYKWDFDGDGKVDSAGQKAVYVYKEPGTYNAALTVFDAQNKEASTVLVVKVAAQGLQARVTANPVEGVVPLTVTFDASGSSYPTGQIVSYEWDFGDGSPKRVDVSKVVYKYTQIGTFTAKVTAIASDNTRSVTTTPINVRPIPLKACFEATTTQGPAPLTIEFDPRCSTGTIAKYSWDFGDGETSRTRKPTHTFTKAGSYELKLEVSDNQNVVDTFSMSILVTGEIN